MSAEADTENVSKGIDGAVESIIESSTFCAAIAEPEHFAEEYCHQKHTATRHPQIKHYHNCKEKTINCIKITCVYMLSYVGLTCIVIGYSILGGFIFNALEQENEVKIEHKALTLREDLVEDINTDFSAVLVEFPKTILASSEEGVKDEMNIIIESFTNKLIDDLQNISKSKCKNSQSQSHKDLCGMLPYIIDHINQERKELIDNAGKSILDVLKKDVTDISHKFFGNNDIINVSKVQDFQEKTYKLVNIDGWNGADPNSKDGSKWTYSGSLLYAVTVITTIGKRIIL